MAAERKSLAAARGAWEIDRAAFLDADRTAREEAEAFRRQVATDLQALRAEAPELDGQAQAVLDRLAAGRDVLRGHLAELGDFARQSRGDLDDVRAQVRAEADRLQAQAADLDRAKAEHRLAVTAFRQQLVDWQARVGEIKRTLTGSESRLEARAAAVDEAARQVDATTQHLAEQADQLRRDRDAVAQRRTSVERHLADMREWYRKKLRDLAGARTRGPTTGRPARGWPSPTPPPMPRDSHPALRTRTWRIWSPATCSSANCCGRTSWSMRRRSPGSGPRPAASGARCGRCCWPAAPCRCTSSPSSRRATSTA